MDKRLFVAAMAGVGIAEAFGAAVAQTGPLDEVVVTAQKRSESAQDVPIAIAAFGGKQMRDYGLRDLRELAEFVPGVTLYDDRGESSQPTWVIRGVGLADFNANNTPTAAIYYDEFYLTSNVMGGIGLFDIERVEVLKGPQGGLYGRNTTGGAVRVQSVRPSFDGYSGYGTFSYGRFGAINVDGAVGGPISDKVAFRLAAMTRQGGGYQDSLVTPKDDNWGDADFWAVRGQLLFEPTDSFSALIKVEGGQDKAETPLGHGIGAYDATGGYCPAVQAGYQDDTTCLHWSNVTNLANGNPVGLLPSAQSGDGKVVLSNPINRLDNDWFSATAQLNWDLNFATLTSITGYIDYNSKQAFDYDGGFLDTGHEFNDSPVSAWSEELRLISNGNGSPLTWMAGFLYAEDKLDEFRTFTFPDNVLIFGSLVSADRGFQQKSKSWAAYGQAEYRLTDAVKAHVSLRYTDEKKRLWDGFSYLNATPGVPGVSPGGNEVPFVVGATKQYKLKANWSGDAGLDWQVSDDAMLYGKVSRGVKSGGFFGGFFLGDAELDPYLEETVWAYEVGFKTDWFDNSLRLNGAAFYYDYSDVQGFISRFSTVTNTLLTKLGNQGGAKHTGVELDAAWAPASIDGLTLTAGGSWLRAIRDTTDTFTGLDGVVRPYDGLRRGNAPKFSYFLQGRYERQLTGSLEGMAQVNYSWRDDLSDVAGSGALINAALTGGTTAYGTLNARVQIGDVDGRWNVALLGKNLTDETYISNQTSDTIGGRLQNYGRPRTWAIELNYFWN